MKGNGNSWSTLLQKLYFKCLPTSGMRTRYIVKHKNNFHSVGEKLFFQPRNYPADPELISIGNNVKIASGVQFINHDVVNSMFCDMDENINIPRTFNGCIEIGNNVMIGANSVILPNVKIGSNVIIAAGAIVSKNIPSGEIWGGVPARCIGKTQELLDKRLNCLYINQTENLWKDFLQTNNGENPKE